jgi:hypothetical protein
VLQALNLRGCVRVTRDSVKHLSSLTGLTDLCLLHNPKLQVDNACLQQLGSLPKLQILGLGNTQTNFQTGEDGLAALSGLGQLSVLSVAFYQGKLGPATNAMLSRMSMLQHLDLQGSSQADATTLRAVGRLTSLQSLHLSRCSNVDDRALEAITRLSNLHTLNISNCYKVTDVGMVLVSHLKALTHLLAQQCVEVTDISVAALGELGALKVLDLSCCERITGLGFQHFRNSSQLVTLTLNSCSGLCDAGLKEIGFIPSLIKLDLSNCPLLSDTGMAYLGGLRMLTGEGERGGVVWCGGGVCKEQGGQGVCMWRVCLSCADAQPQQCAPAPMHGIPSHSCD